MALPNISHSGACVIIGQESSYGVPATRTNTMRVLKNNLRRKVTHTPRVTLDQINPRAAAITGDELGGPIVFEANYSDSTAMILKHLFGTVTDGGSGPNGWTHTYGWSPNVENLSLSIEGIFGSSGDAEVGAGCVANSWTFEIPTKGVCTLSVDWIGKTTGGRLDTGTSPTFSSNDNPMLGQHGSVLAWKSLSARIISGSLQVNMSKSRRPQVGVLDTLQPVTTGPTEVILRVTREYDEYTVYGDHLDGDTGNATITLTDGTRSFALTLVDAKCIEYGDPVEGPGVTQQTIVLRAFNASPLSAVLTNSNQLYSAN